MMPHDHGPHDHGHDHDHHHDHDHDHADEHGHEHGPAHGHSHHHGHHHHGPARHDAAFAIGVALNGTLVAAQIGFGLAAGSMALLADATHNLGDVLGLLLAWAAATLGRRAPTASRTYGWGRFSILAALANAMILLVSIGAIGLGAVQRLLAPGPVDGAMVAWVAAIGMAINTATALLFMRGREHDLNLRSAFVHMVADAAISAGVLVAALVTMRTGLTWIDPAVSLVIVVIIGLGTWNLLRESVNLALDAVPEGVDPRAITAWLEALPGVAEVHDLHVWALSTTETAVTAHLVQAEAGPAEALTRSAVLGLREKFRIGHATIQIETASVAETCTLRPAGVV